MSEAADIVQVSARIRHIYISPSHNFRGHHGVPPGENPIVGKSEIRCVAGRGIEGDRYFDTEENFDGQITFFSCQIFERLCEAISSPDCKPSAMRRNVITDGVDLNTLIGREFEIQGVRFLGTEECHPCYWMDQAVGPGAKDFLRGNGGLRARILTDGILRVNC